MKADETHVKREERREKRELSNLRYFFWKIGFNKDFCPYCGEKIIKYPEEFGLQKYECSNESCVFNTEGRNLIDKFVDSLFLLPTLLLFIPFFIAGIFMRYLKILAPLLILILILAVLRGGFLV